MGIEESLYYQLYVFFYVTQVTGVITTKEGEAKWVLTGTWDKKMEGAKILHVDESNKGKPVFETGPHFTLWERKPLS